MQRDPGFLTGEAQPLRGASMLNMVTGVNIRELGLTGGGACWLRPRQIQPLPWIHDYVAFLTFTVLNTTDPEAEKCIS